MKKNVLTVKFYSNDLREHVTVRDYLKRLLKTLWSEEEGFSGKRPFGNSGWKHDVAVACIQAGLLEGTLDEDGYADDYNEARFDKLIRDAISQLR